MLKYYESKGIIGLMEMEAMFFEEYEKALFKLANWEQNKDISKAI